MEDTVTITRAEYEALLEAKEDAEDIAIIERHLADPQEGLPSKYLDRILDDGASLLTVFREWRGMNQSELARASGVNRVQIADIEAGRKTGSVTTLKKLADTLGIKIDDLI